MPFGLDFPCQHRFLGTPYIYRFTRFIYRILLCEVTDLLITALFSKHNHLTTSNSSCVISPLFQIFVILLLTGPILPDVYALAIPEYRLSVVIISGFAFFRSQDSGTMPVMLRFATVVKVRSLTTKDLSPSHIGVTDYIIAVRFPVQARCASGMGISPIPYSTRLL